MRRGALLAARLCAPVLAVQVFYSSPSVAQNSGDTGAESNANAAGNGEAGPATSPAGSGSTTTTSVTSSTYGLPPPGTKLEAHLGSSSRAKADINEADSFDLDEPGSGTVVVRGRADSMGVGLGRSSSTTTAPELHIVKKGDTLWDLCGSYYGNPWMWPTLWSQNPQLQNPHWIYPGDQLRLRSANGASLLGQSQILGSGTSLRRSLVPKQTVFLRDLGYIDDPSDEIWGELVGAHEEQLMLSEGNHVYMILRPGVEARVGQLLSVFRTARKVEKVPGARMPPGELIAFKGSIKIDQFEPKTRVARGTIVESLDVIERGAKVGPVGRRFDVVSPKESSVDVQARVLTSMYPHPFVGREQVVFLDRGSHDGLVAGNRLFILRRGDTWRQTLSATGSTVGTRVRLDDPETAATEETPIKGDDEDFPEEVVAELRIVRTHKWSSLALITEAAREVEPGDRAVARRGH